jgi:hypothetical protein
MPLGRCRRTRPTRTPWQPTRIEREEANEDREQCPDKYLGVALPVIVPCPASMAPQPLPKHAWSSDPHACDTSVTLTHPRNSHLSFTSTAPTSSRATRPRRRPEQLGRAIWTEEMRRSPSAPFSST